MAHEPAMDDDMLMMIFGGDPEGGKPKDMKPGIHGKTEVTGAPEGTPEEFLASIRDQIDEYLNHSGAPEKPEKDSEEEPPAEEEEE